MQVNNHLSEEINHPDKNDFFERVKMRFMNFLEKMILRKKLILACYSILTIGLVLFFMNRIGRDMMPRTNSGQFQIRLKEPDGTRLEETESKLKQLLTIVDSTTQHHMAVSSSYIGLVPSSY